MVGVWAIADVGQYQVLIWFEWDDHFEEDDDERKTKKYWKNHQDLWCWMQLKMGSLENDARKWLTEWTWIMCCVNREGRTPRGKVAGEVVGNSAFLAIRP